MDTSWTKAKSRFVPQKNPWRRRGLENRGKQRVAPVKGAVSTKAARGRRVEEERKREGRHECARTRRDERAKAPVALSGGGSIPHHHEFARVQRFTNPPAVVCLSASCTLTTTSILNQTPLLFSFHPRFWQPPASFHPFLEGQETWSTRRIKLHAIQIQYPFLFPSSSVELLLGYTSIRSLFLAANFGCRLDVCEFVRFLGSFCGLAFDPFAFWEVLFFFF